MENKDYPNYFIAGDCASLKTQSYYIRYVKCDLILMIIAAILSIYNYQKEESKLIVYVISGLMMLFAMLISIILKTKKYEDVWYRGRALAESCKTLAWRYVMCSEYFEHALSIDEANQKFVERVK